MARKRYCLTFALEKANRRERGPFPFHLPIILISIFPYMAGNNTIGVITGLLNGVLEEFPDVFVIQVKIKPVNNIKVFVDTDEGISIDTCIRINRKMYKAIEGCGEFPEGDFSLEVSSPGVGEPILLNRQYRKNTGRTLSVVLKDERILEGKLTEATEDGIVLEEIKGKGKKQEVILHSLLYEDIKKAVVAIKF